MAGLFSPATLEQIRAASDIVDIVGTCLPLKRAGANFVALCPFHKEKTPSFHVNPQRQIFYCFGCHKGGDVFAFVKEYENVDFPEAVRRLAERAKVPLEFERGGQEPQSRHLKEQLLQLHEQIAQRWQHTLANEPAGQAARDYLGKRAVSPEAVKLFRLGCAPEAWDDTVNWARNLGHDLGLVEKAGLILRKEGTDRYYDRFRGRLMFPICDEQGRVIGFSGRVLAGDEKTAKYVNSPETPIFTKSKVFFGLDKSKRALVEAEFAVVCEGQLDLIACFMAGVENVVAPQGTAFTADHARILKRYVNEVVLCFDSDEAGQNAAARSLDHLLAAELAVRVAVVPPPHDPDSFIKALGGRAFKQLIERAEGFFDYYLNRLCSMNEVTTDRGRLAVLRGMAEAAHKTGNVVLVDTYAQKTALRLGVAPDAVRAEFRKLARARTPAQTSSEGRPEATAELPHPSPQEYWLLKLALTHDNLVPWLAAHLDLAWVQHPLAKQIIQKRLAGHNSQSWTSLAAFLAECETPELRNLVTEVAVEERIPPSPAQHFAEATIRPATELEKAQGEASPAQHLADVILRLRNQAIDRQIAALKQRLNQPNVPEPENDALLRRQQELRSSKQRPLVPLDPESQDEQGPF
ncbi:MAG TPA: DNA primase [Dongiaceae bacterium]|nr:DNA primase [Dongiaceae bacterium]